MVTYPKEFETHIRLRNGTKVILRSIRPEDEMLWLEMFRSFSEKSVWNRFFNVIQKTPHELRVRYCDIDYDREIAIIAELQEEERKMLGVVRFNFDSDMKKGELAFIVVDRWQNLGLGTMMVQHMINVCKEKKVESIYSFILPNNYGSIRFLKRLGFTMDYSYNEQVKAILNINQNRS
jgi:acetyltransferase